jgi:hypothetical protein
MIAFSLEVSGFKWELSRFLMLGYFYGNFVLMISINKLIENNYIKKRIYIFLIIFMLIGPVINSVSTFYLSVTAENYNFKNILSYILTH